MLVAVLYVAGYVTGILQFQYLNVNSIQLNFFQLPQMYQWKLLNHVSRDHNMTLKPAHLSYKCTVCTATFGMYKQFENHVYSAHSTVAKKAMDNKKAPGPGSSKSGDSLLKPLKINDEITIIPQPASRHSQKNMEIESHVIGKSQSSF